MLGSEKSAATAARLAAKAASLVEITEFLFCEAIVSAEDSSEARDEPLNCRLSRSIAERPEVVSDESVVPVVACDCWDSDSKALAREDWLEVEEMFLGGGK